MYAYILPVAIVGGIGLLSGVVLTLAAKFMSVPVDERFDLVRAALPGANCGACGFAGCDDYANALVAGTAKGNLCTPGGEAAAKGIGEALGIEVEKVESLHAIVKCSGTCEKTEYVMEYRGAPTCEACNYFYQGRGKCSHACLGFGDCVTVCQYDAIRIVDGVAVIDKAKCTGCGMCVKSCPNNLIGLVPSSSDVYVACSSTDKGAFTRKVCSAGCIGCKKCERACQYGAVTITENLASIDAVKCVNCGECVGVCPTQVIKKIVCDNIIEQKKNREAS